MKKFGKAMIVANACTMAIVMMNNDSCGVSVEIPDEGIYATKYFGVCQEDGTERKGINAMIQGGISTASGTYDINPNEWEYVQPGKENKGSVIFNVNSKTSIT